MKMIKSDYKERYQNCEDVINDLKKIEFGKIEFGWWDVDCCNRLFLILEHSINIKYSNDRMLSQAQELSGADGCKSKK